MTHSRKALDIVPGTVYGKLTIIGEAPRYRKPSGQTVRMFNCKCHCGRYTQVKLDHLRSGNTKGCGCVQKEHIKNLNKSHGMSGTKVNDIYRQINQRCYNKKCKAYKNYGGRGIKNLWNSFEEFYNDMGSSYKEGLTLDRKNNNSHYCKENCHWANRETQANNTRQCRLLNYNGIELSMAQWAKKLGVNVNTFRARYYKGLRGKDLFSK